MITNYKVTIASPPDREHLVAEVFFGDVQWVEINQERDTLEVEFYPRPDGEPWRIPLSAAMSALAEAKQRLIE